MNNKGQSILSEYVMVFFVVIAAAVAMTIYIQRALEARVHDARNFVADSVASSGACDANCLHAINDNRIPYEYEPYYTQVLSDMQQNASDKTGATQGNAQAIGAIYVKSTNEQTKAITTSKQLPPQCANGVDPKPAFCG